jgi:hypothetical protein
MISHDALTLARPNLFINCNSPRQTFSSFLQLTLQVFRALFSGPDLLKSLQHDIITTFFHCLILHSLLSFDHSHLECRRSLHSSSFNLPWSHNIMSTPLKPLLVGPFPISFPSC